MKEYNKDLFELGFISGYIHKMAEDINYIMNKFLEIKYIDFKMDIFYVPEYCGMTLNDAIRFKIDKNDVNVCKQYVNDFENIRGLFYNLCVKYGFEYDCLRKKQLLSEISESLEYDIFHLLRKKQYTIYKINDCQYDSYLNYYMYVIFESYVVKIDDYYILFIIGSNE